MSTRAVDQIFSRYWAMTEDALGTIIKVSMREGDVEKARDMRKKNESIKAEMKAELNKNQASDIAIIDAVGPLFRHANLLTEVSGATSYDEISKNLIEAADDPSIREIILHIDSPGGEVAGLSDLSDLIAQIKQKKPVTSYISGLGASAGYWIASATDRIVASPTAIVGSIGVQSAVRLKEDEKDEIVFVSSFSPLKNKDPRTKEGADGVQKVVDDLALNFIDTVAKNRSISRDDVLNRYGRGAVFVANPEAKTRGMVDDVKSFNAHVSDRINLYTSNIAKNNTFKSKETKSMLPIEGEKTMKRASTERLEEQKIMFTEAKRFGDFELYEKALKSEMSLTDFRGELLERRQNGASAVNSYSMKTQTEELGLSEGQIKDYSIARALYALALNEPSLAKNELRISNEIAEQKRERRGNSNRKLFIPFEVASYGAQDVFSPRAGTGSSLIQTDVRNDSIIEMLQNRSWAARCGVNFMTGMINDASFPKHTQEVSYQWLKASQEADLQEMGIDDDVYLSAKYLGTRTWLSTDLLANTTASVEGFTRRKISEKLGEGVDQTLIIGSGQGNEPLGMLANDEIETIAINTNGGKLSWDHIVDMETAVDNKNYNGDTTYYLSNSKVKGLLKKTREGQDLPFIYRDGRINETPFFMTNMVPSNLTKGSAKNLSAMIYGDFSTIMVGMWGDIELIVNPYRNDKKLFMSVYMRVDYGYEYPQALSKIVDIVTTNPVSSRSIDNA